MFTPAVNGPELTAHDVVAVIEPPSRMSPGKPPGLPPGVHAGDVGKAILRAAAGGAAAGYASGASDVDSAAVESGASADLLSGGGPGPVSRTRHPMPSIGGASAAAAAAAAAGGGGGGRGAAAAAAPPTAAAAILPAAAAAAAAGTWAKVMSKIASLEARNSDLEATVADLTARLAALEAMAGYEEAQALPVSDEMDGDLREVLDYLEAESYEAQRTLPVDAEVGGEMDECLDYIEAQQYTPRRAMSASAEVDGEMDEVLDCIDEQQHIPRRRAAVPAVASVAALSPGDALSGLSNRSMQTDRHYPPTDFTHEQWCGTRDSLFDSKAAVNILGPDGYRMLHSAAWAMHYAGHYYGDAMSVVAHQSGRIFLEATLAVILGRPPNHFELIPARLEAVRASQKYPLTSSETSRTSTHSPYPPCTTTPRISFRKISLPLCTRFTGWPATS